MKKIFISSLLISTTFWGVNLPDDEQQKALKEVMKKYGETTVAVLEENLKDKESLDSCQKYLDKADEILNKADKSITSVGDYSLYASALMKRYEICLSKKVK